MSNTSKPKNICVIYSTIKFLTFLFFLGKYWLHALQRVYSYGRYFHAMPRINLHSFTSTSKFTYHNYFRDQCYKSGSDSDWKILAGLVPEANNFESLQQDDNYTLTKETIPQITYENSSTSRIWTKIPLTVAPKYTNFYFDRPTEK